MRMIYHDEEQKIRDFAEEAAKNFRENEHYATYTENGRVECGELFAVRWGTGYSVLVFQLDDCFEPTVYCGLVEKFAPKLDKAFP